MGNSSRPGPIRHVLGTFWTGLTYLRIALGNLLLLGFIVLIIVAMRGQAPEPIDNNTALRLNPAGIVVDQKSYVDPLADLLSDGAESGGEVLLADMIEAVKLAADDSRISALVMELDYTPGLGTSKSGELASAIAAFRAAGKPVIAWNDSFLQSQYLLATEADEIIIDPMGGVLLQGFANYQWHFRTALDALAVNMHVFQAGAYKSATEVFLRDDMSEPEKRITRRWLSQAWTHYTNTVEENRELEDGAIDALIADLPARVASQDGGSAETALAAGLVDRLLPRYDANEYIAGVVGGTGDDGYYRAVDFTEYLRRKRLTVPTFDNRPQVAVIAARGSMRNGNQPAGSIGGESLARLIGDAIDDESIQAIVLRMDTGGGSTFAAELIRRQVARASAAQKPVVVSMGSVTASGGVWVATAADRILATPTTVTGSIGVFAAFPTFERALAKLGVGVDGVGSTALAGDLRPDQDVSQASAEILQAGVDHTHSQFVDLVAESRGMPREEALALADGSVFLGSKALELGLVDGLGSLEDAVAVAAELANLDEDEYRAINYEPVPSPREQFLRSLTGNTLRVLGVQLPGWQRSLASISAPLILGLELLDSLDDPRHLYVHCLGCAAP
ncbi:MAG: signal peptide peptidase SppA [Pseudomonadota bacterium]